MKIWGQTNERYVLKTGGFMKVKDYEGKVVDASMEVVKERQGIFVTWSTLREPTKKEIRTLRKRKCNHEHQPIQLITDEYGFMYDMRSCVICGQYLGTV